MDTRLPPEFDVATLLEGPKITAFQAQTFILCFLILVVDGLDYSAANVAAPAILRAFQAETSAMGIVFSMGFVGILIGSVGFGWVGDRLGRKTGAVWGVVAYSLPALMTVSATSMDQLTFYRALAGVGIGGVIPNIIALLNETAPKRFRVTFVMAVFIGYSTGNAVAGQIAALLIPEFGWQVIFLVAGIAGLGLSLILALTLPESIPFLAATKPDAPQLRRLVARAAPDLAILPHARFVYRRPVSETRFSLRLLFEGYRRIATPLIWLAFLAESMCYLTFTAWLLVVLEAKGVAPARAAAAYSYGQLSAIAATLIVACLFDRVGPVASALSAALSVVAILAVGLPGLSQTLMIVVAICAVAVASATHQSLNGMVGGFYPTVVRGNGVGYASGMGRIGAIVGPAAVGYLLPVFSPQAVLAFIAAPDLIVAAACFGLDRCARARLKEEA